MSFNNKYNQGLFGYVFLAGLVVIFISNYFTYSSYNNDLHMFGVVKNYVLYSWPPNIWNKPPICIGELNADEFMRFQESNGFANSGLILVTIFKFISDFWLLDERGHNAPLRAVLVLIAVGGACIAVASIGIICSRATFAATTDKPMALNSIINTFYIFVAHLTFWVLIMLFWRKIKYVLGQKRARSFKIHH